MTSVVGERQSAEKRQWIMGSAVKEQLDIGSTAFHATDSFDIDFRHLQEVVLPNRTFMRTRMKDDSVAIRKNANSLVETCLVGSVLFSRL